MENDLKVLISKCLAGKNDFPSSRQVFQEAYAMFSTKYEECKNGDSLDGKLLFEILIDWGNLLEIQAEHEIDFQEFGLRCFREASAKFGDAAQMAPENILCFYNWANLLSAWAKQELKVGHVTIASDLLDDAISRYRRANELEPMRESVLYNLHLAYEAKESCSSREDVKKYYKRKSEQCRKDAMVMRNGKWNIYTHDVALMKIQPGVDEKDKGNAYFKSGDFKKALGRYMQAITHLLGLNELQMKDRELCDSLTMNCYLNMAFCFLKTSQPDLAIEYSTKALEIDPRDIKALYRRGLAHMMKNDFESAKEDLQLARKHGPRELAIQQALEQLHQKQQSQDMRDKEMYQKIFS